MKIYDEMSNFEINQFVAAAMGKKISLERTEMYIDLSRSMDVKDDAIFIVNSDNFESFDPCSNPSDAWPIIVDNEIAIKPCVTRSHRGIWMASDNYAIPEFLVKDKNPLRAAMICFLKMKDAEK